MYIFLRFLAPFFITLITPSPIPVIVSIERISRGRNRRNKMERGRGRGRGVTALLIMQTNKTKKTEQNSKKNRFLVKKKQKQTQQKLLRSEASCPCLTRQYLYVTVSVMISQNIFSLYFKGQYHEIRLNVILSAAYRNAFFFFEVFDTNCKEHIKSQDMFLMQGFGHCSLEGMNVSKSFMHNVLSKIHS